MDLVSHGDSHSKTEFLFASQLTYGPFGSRLCTPVCAIVSSNFIFALPELPISSIFDPDRIDRAMQCSHDLYAKIFAKTKKNLMYQDIFSFFPTQLETLEFAGLLGNQNKEAMENIEDVLILADINHVFDFLCKFLDAENIRFSLMITCQEHTVCFLFDFSNKIWCFDPLKASLFQLGVNFSPSSLFYAGKSTEGVEYAGMLLLPEGCKNKLLHLLKQ